MSRPAARAARRLNAQLRRLRAGLEQARETMAIHFGENDEAVRAADRALAPSGTLKLEPLSPSTHPTVKNMKGITQ